MGKGITAESKSPKANVDMAGKKKKMQSMRKKQMGAATKIWEKIKGVRRPEGAELTNSVVNNWKWGSEKGKLYGMKGRSRGEKKTQRVGGHVQKI